MAGVKSTKTLGYALKGFLNKEDMNIVEVTDEGEIVHDLDELFQFFDGKEVALAVSMKDKLENGVE